MQKPKMALLSIYYLLLDIIMTVMTMGAISLNLIYPLNRAILAIIGYVTGAMHSLFSSASRQRDKQFYLTMADSPRQMQAWNRPETVPDPSLVYGDRSLCVL